MGQFILVNGEEISEMAMGSKNGLMGQNIPGNGKIIKHGVSVNLIIMTEIFILVNGLMIKLMVLEYTNISMDLGMKVIGKMMFSMDWDWKIGLILQIILENIIMEKNKD